MKKILTLISFALLSLNTFSQYCQPSATFSACALTNDFWITDVSFTGTGSTFAYTGGTCISTSPYYLNTGYQGDVIAGNTYTLSITRAGNTYLTKFNVWVDWDTNFVLNDVTPFVENIAANLSLAAGAALTSTATVTIPSSVSPGVHRMRVRVQYNATNGNNPCLTNGQAETKDFNLNVVNNSVGIEERINTDLLTIFPNPFTTQTKISFTEEQKNVSVKITDVLGKIVLQKEFADKTKEIVIERGEMLKGLYFLEIKCDNKKQIIRKRVVQ